MIQLIVLLELGARAATAAGESWALLAAGSSGWENYRHQSDVYHAYQLLCQSYEYRNRSRIIMMAQDDIAYNAHNPRRGQVFNDPSLNNDVYAAARGNIDHSGKAVDSKTFLSVLEGVGEGKVMSSGPGDRVFIFFSDHGAAGMLGMPSGPPLYADEIYLAIKRKKSRGGFAEMLIYIESCEAGSIFQGFDYEELNVDAVTASNADESSWATYCPGFGPEPSSDTEGLDVCLGDLFSVSWIEDTQNHLARNEDETLEEQYLVSKSLNTFSMGSHVSQFGALALDREAVTCFEGHQRFESSMVPTPPNPPINAKQHAADLVPLRDWKLEEELRRRGSVESKARLIEGAFGDVFLHSTKRPLDAPLVDDRSHFRSLISSWERICCSPNPLDSYSMSFSRLFARLTNSGVSASHLSEAWREIKARSEIH